MMAIENRSVLSRIRELPTWLAIFLIPIALIFHQWNPCDSTASVAAGDTLVHIGICLAIGLLVAVGKVFSRSNFPDHGANATDLGRIAFWCGATLFCAWLACITWFVVGHGNARHAVNGFWQWSAMIVLGASIACLTARPGFSENCLTLLLAIAIGVIAYGFWEYGVIQPELQAQLQRDPVGLFRREGVAVDSSAGMLLADRIRSTEMRSVFALANSLGGFLASAWVVLIGLGMTVWQTKVTTSNPSDRKSKNKYWVMAIAIACALVAVALLLTKSRTAWVAAGFGTVGMGIAHRMSFEPGGAKRVRYGWLSILIAVAAIGGAGAVYAFDPLILREAGKSLAYRWDYWRGAMVLIAERPWLGYGCGNFQSTYLSVKLPTAAESPADPHNFLLEIAHAGGFVLLAIGFACGALATVIWLREIRTPQQTARVIDQARGDTWLFWSGAGAAGLGVAAWSFFTASDSQLMGAWFAVAVAALCVALLKRLPAASTSAHRLVQYHPGWLWIAVAATSVHLLASGGWMLPGTMAMTMVLIGLGVHGRRGVPVALGKRYRLVIAAGAVGLMLGWYATMALPLARGVAALNQTLGSTIAASASSVRSMVDADALDPELARLGMGWCVEQLERPTGALSRQEWESLLSDLRSEFLARDPGHAMALEACGQIGLRVAATHTNSASRNTWLRRADDDLQAASQAYPASAQGHVQAAVGAYLANDTQRALEHCEAAEKIDAATPHRDRKIRAAQVLWPRSLEPTEAGLPQDARLGIPKDFVRAEPVVHYLRSLPLP